MYSQTKIAIPIFQEKCSDVIAVAEDCIEQQRIALLLSRILKAMSHDLENGVMIIVQH